MGTPSLASVAVAAAIPPSTCCAWTPYLLSERARRSAVSLVRMEVPSLVSLIRRELSVELAIGAIEQKVPGVCYAGMLAGRPCFPCMHAHNRCPDHGAGMPTAPH